MNTAGVRGSDESLVSRRLEEIARTQRSDQERPSKEAVERFEKAMKAHDDKSDAGSPAEEAAEDATSLVEATMTSEPVSNASAADIAAAVAGQASQADEAARAAQDARTPASQENPERVVADRAEEAAARRRAADGQASEEERDAKAAAEAAAELDEATASMLAQAGVETTDTSQPQPAGPTPEQIEMVNRLVEKLADPSTGVLVSMQPGEDKVVLNLDQATLDGASITIEKTDDSFEIKFEAGEEASELLRSASAELAARLEATVGQQVNVVVTPRPTSTEAAVAASQRPATADRALSAARGERGSSGRIGNV